MSTSIIYFSMHDDSRSNIINWECRKIIVGVL